MTSHESLERVNVKRGAAGSRGFTLVEVLIGSALLCIGLVVFASVMNFQSRETTAENQSLAALDLQRTLLSALADGTVCSYQLTNPPGTTYDFSTVGTPSPLTISLLQIPASASPTAPMLASVGGLASPLSSNLTVQAITIDGIKSAGVPDLWLATYDIQFTAGSLVRGVPNVSAQVLFQTTGPLSSKKVLACMSSVGASGSVLNTGTQVQDFMTAGNYVFTVPAGVTKVYVRLVGPGGGGGGNWSTASAGGGGSGGYAEGSIVVTPGQTIPIIVGQGGAGGSPGPLNQGGAGGPATQFGSYLSATGGQGGMLDAAGVITAGGSWGQGSGGQLNLSGGYGGDGNPLNPTVQGGQGAPSAFGGGGQSARGNSTAANARAPGAGGGGTWDYNNGGPLNGGKGADGAVIVTY